MTIRKCFLCRRESDLHLCVAWPPGCTTPFDTCLACADEHGNKLSSKLVSKLGLEMLTAALASAPAADGWNF